MAIFLAYAGPGGFLPVLLVALGVGAAYAVVALINSSRRK